MSVIELKDIAKTYYIGGKLPVYALRGVSLKIDQGEFVAIMGASGSGKSTLLAILGLLDQSDAGEYKLLDKDINHLQENDYAKLRNRFFGFIFQTFNLLPKLNVISNTMLPFVYAGEVTEENRQKALARLKQIGLGDRLDHRPNELSGGQQQRVAVARALANNPIVILADEPTGNLDSKSSAEIMQILKDLNDQGNTIIMVTHERAMAEQASRIITLHDGKIDSDEVKRKTKRVEDSRSELTDKKDKGLFTFGRLKDYCYEAFVSVFNNKLRSFLSILGVLIGVAAVITMLALGTGAKQNIEDRLSSLGTNLLNVQAERGGHGGVSTGSNVPTRFNFTDHAAIKRVDGVAKVVPYVRGNAQVVYKNKNWSTSVYGTDSEYQHVKDSVPVLGRFFTLTESLGRSKITVLGKTVANELFGDEDPVGKFIRVNRVNFEVIGVMPEKGASGWRNNDDQIVVPIKTAMYRLLGKDYIDYFDVQVESQGIMAQVQEDIVAEILQNHRLPASQADTISIRNMAEIQEAAGAMINTLSMLLGGIAAISLLVGGIGIMNIMLVMVMERTHEIGLRKALGAQRGDIMIQFLVESILICVFGGLLGILLGSGVSWLASSFAGWNTVVSFWSVMLAFTFSVLIGLIFGLWPAWRASKLLPIVALRYE
ncbi:MAG: ABC transporter permease [bacterium]